jgi:hypothetical protein
MNNEFVSREGQSPEQMKDMERWRLNLQIKSSWAERRELANDPECPDAVIGEFDQKLGQMLAAQEELLGGVAKPARGILRGSYQPPVAREPSPNPLKPWLGEQIAAVALFKLNGRTDYKPVCENRRARRQWSHHNPFRKANRCQAGLGL